jgi:sulfonate transport system permease protein
MRDPSTGLADSSMDDALRTEVTARTPEAPGADAPALPREAGRGGFRARAIAINAVSVACALGAWQLLTLLVKSPYFPSPAQIVEAFVLLLERGDIQGTSLWTHVWSSLYRILVGFGASVLLGVPLGLLMGLYKNVYASLRAVIEPFRFIPPIAWIPLAIIFFSGITRFAFLIFIGAFFPIFTATMVGVSRVEPIHRKVALVHGAGKLYILQHIIIPTVLPDILGGMRVGLGAAWLTIVAAELVGGSTSGLGRMMVNYSELLRIPEVVVGMILIGLIGLAMNEALLLLEKYLFRWRWEVKL